MLSARNAKIITENAKKEREQHVSEVVLAEAEAIGEAILSAANDGRTSVRIDMSKMDFIQHLVAYLCKHLGYSYEIKGYNLTLVWG